MAGYFVVKGSLTFDASRGYKPTEPLQLFVAIRAVDGSWYLCGNETFYAPNRFEVVSREFTAEEILALLPKEKANG